jgi:hypothetical protein
LLTAHHAVTTNLRRPKVPRPFAKNVQVTAATLSSNVFLQTHLLPFPAILLLCLLTIPLLPLLPFPDILLALQVDPCLSFQLPFLHLQCYHLTLLLIPQLAAIFT